MVISTFLRLLCLRCEIKKRRSIATLKRRRRRRSKKLKKGVEVTRFKGLGEISPDEFKQFIGKDMRIIPVTVNYFSDIKPTLQFYMGKNTPERKKFIMKNLDQR